MTAGKSLQALQIISRITWEEAMKNPMELSGQLRIYKTAVRAGYKGS